MPGVHLEAVCHRHRGRAHRGRSCRLGHRYETLEDQCEPRQQPDHLKATRALELMDGRHHGPTTISPQAN